MKHNLQHKSYKNFQVECTFFLTQHDRKQLTVLMSCLSGILTATLLLLQLHGILLMKVVQQQRHLQHFRDEAILSRNSALTRYRRAKQRFVIL